MAGMNVDGLVSGLDTTSLINQLMQLERQPQNRLQSRLTQTNKVADLYRGLNTRLDAVATAAAKLSGVDGWRHATGTSSDTDLATVASTSSAQSGTITFKVQSLATAHTVASTGTASDTTTALGNPADFAGFTINGTAVDVGDASLASIRDGINASDSGVVATIVKVGAADYRLQLTADTNGAGVPIDVQGFATTSLGTLDLEVQAGSSASVLVGDGAGAYTVTSDTNVIADLLPGTTVTLKKADPLTAVTVSVADDSAKAADDAAALVTALNDALAFIKTNSAYDPVTKKAGALLSDSRISQLRSDLTRAVTDLVGGTATSGADAGITIDRNGVATFDRAKFIAAYEANPTSLRRIFDDGVAGTADDGVARRLRTFVDGSAEQTIDSALDSFTSTTRQLQSQIDNWDVRLTLRETALKRQFASLERALGQSKNMSNWLSGQIASLPTSG